MSKNQRRHNPRPSTDVLLGRVLTEDIKKAIDSEIELTIDYIVMNHEELTHKEAIDYVDRTKEKIMFFKIDKFKEHITTNQLEEIEDMLNKQISVTKFYLSDIIYNEWGVFYEEDN